jgi:hypothetical protein
LDRYIIKEDGSLEIFNEEKIRRSLEKSGADEGTITGAIERVKRDPRNRVPSKEIYRSLLKHLKSRKPDIALKYKLKRSIMDLGPTGYVFEKYVAKIFTEYGYKTEVSRIVKGFCVDHEVDVVAEKDNLHYMIECKYHNDLDMRSDIKTALYVHSRFEDIKKACMLKNNGFDMKEGWLVTNTSVTSEVIKYSECIKMKVIAWHYPELRNLEYYIENKKLYPISILNGLSSWQKNTFYENEIITVRDLLKYNAGDIEKLIKIKKDNAEKLFIQTMMLVS